jgi:23S rRNA (uridine2552-2'-O)-methyltransferase
MADYKKPDHWQLKARKEGYPARSVYKLQEMEQKFGLFKSASMARQPFRVLDLGAAPGSWSLYVLRTIRDKVFLVSADLSPLSREFDCMRRVRKYPETNTLPKQPNPVRSAAGLVDKGLFSGDNFCFIQGDITDPAIRDSIMEKGPYNLIISDAAPATTGNRFVDTTRSLELAETVATYAESSLLKGGNLIVKVFQGGDVSDLLKRLKTLFTSAKSYKPLACRSESFETYYVGLNEK